jgi:diguanylate cyclase (GGDEF)-like protein
MAVPIIFKDRLLGVIGIGEIENPIGNEGDLLKMIADIAGVALFNQIIFNDAQHKANTDSLTGLNNRNYFSQMSQHYVEKSLREGTVISFFLFDIDNFKHYNDTNGHNAGDKLLIELGRLLRSASRKSSIVARYGGEEFIVMLPGISKEDAFIYAERLREQISQYPFQYKEKQSLGFVSISGGIAAFPEDGDSVNKVIQNADISLYQAKSEGKNRVLVHKA